MTSTANDVVLAITVARTSELIPGGEEPVEFPGEFVDEDYRNRTLRTAHSYDQFAPAIARAADAADRSWLAPFVRTFATVARKGGRVLDLGGGAGRESVELAAAGYRVYEFDISRGMLQIARVRETVIAAVQGDMTELPFRDSAFDAVWAQASLHHLEVPDVEDALYSIRRVLKAGGAFFSTMQSGTWSGWDGPSSAWAALDSTQAADSKRWYSLADPDEWRDILQDCGFSIHNFEVTPRNPSNNAEATGWINVLAVAE